MKRQWHHAHRGQRVLADIDADDGDGSLGGLGLAACITGAIGFAVSVAPMGEAFAARRTNLAKANRLLRLRVIALEQLLMQRVGDAGFDAALAGAVRRGQHPPTPCMIAAMSGLC